MHKSPNNAMRGAIISFGGVAGSAFFWLLSFKAISYWMGPEGVGLFSQLRQMIQAVTVAATFGGTNSVVQGLSENDDNDYRLRFRSTVSRIICLAGVLFVLAILLTAPFLAVFFLSSDAPELVEAVRWISLATLLNIAGTYALGVLNGYRSYRYMAIAQISGPLALVLSLILASMVVPSKDPQILALCFVACFATTCVIGLLGVHRLPVLPVLPVAPRGNVLRGTQFRAFLGFALSNMVAALSATIALLFIRSWVIDMKGLAFAGLFDAGWTLTFNYTTLLLTASSVIYLPLLTAAKTPATQKACILKTAYLVFAASIFICYAIVMLKGFLIGLLYSPQFKASESVLMILVIAVIFRSISWVYGTVILATRNSRVLLVSDIALNLFLMAATSYALHAYGSLEALSWAFVVPNFLYMAFVIEYVHAKNHLMKRRLIWPLVAAGVVPLLILDLMSAVMQGDHGVAGSICVLAGLAVSATALMAYRRVVS